MKIDKDNDGYITIKELRYAMKGKFSDEELEQILRVVDADKNGAINYTEFIAATLNAQLYENRDKMQNAFEMMDRDGDGFIEESELAEMMGCKEDYDRELVMTLIAEVDENRDGKIDFNEFKKMLNTMSKRTWVAA